MTLQLSLAEKKWIEGGISVNIRSDGRGLLDFRSFIVETGLLPQPNGSSRIRIGSTDILVGVKAEWAPPDTETPNEGRVQFLVECCPTASRAFEGRGGEDINTQLAGLLQRVYAESKVIDTQKLCIIPGKVVWVLYIDVMVLDFGGNLIDAISLATYAALKTSLIPVVSIVEDQPEIDDNEEYTSLDLPNLPICISLTKVGKGFVIDASTEEEACMSCRMSIAVNKIGNIVFMQKGGSGGIDPAHIPGLISAAITVGKQTINNLEKLLEEEKKAIKSGREIVGFFSPPNPA